MKMLITIVHHGIFCFDTGMHSDDTLLSLIVSYSRIVSNYFESKSDIYSLLITVELIYVDKKN